MSKKLFSFMIGELGVIRLICKQPKCGAVAEVDVDRLSKSKTIKCPCCQMIYEDLETGSLFQLGKAIRALRNNAEVDVEFVLPVKD